MLCPKCKDRGKKSDSKVRETVHIPAATGGAERTYRTRRCYNRHIFHTIEQVTDVSLRQLLPRIDIADVRLDGED